MQTSDALGAAGVQLGPGVVALVVELHTEMGVPLARSFRGIFDIPMVTPDETSWRVGADVLSGGRRIAANRQPAQVQAYVRDRCICFKYCEPFRILRCLLDARAEIRYGVE